MWFREISKKDLEGITLLQSINLIVTIAAANWIIFAVFAGPFLALFGMMDIEFLVNSVGWSFVTLIVTWILTLLLPFTDIES